MTKGLPEGWKLLSSRYLHREDWLTVRQDELQLPNGHIISKYFVLEYPDWVNTIAITKEGSFVLVKQYRHAIDGAAFELCAGVVDPGEDPLQAARRELMEETGYGGGTWEKWMVIAPNPATSNNWVHCFIAKDVEKKGAPAPEPSEELAIHLAGRDELMRMVTGGGIIQATHLTPLWKFIAQKLNSPA